MNTLIQVYAVGSERVYLTPDPRGESETYEAWLLVGYRSGRRVWTEGVCRDRTHMRPELRCEIEKRLAPTWP